MRCSLLFMTLWGACAPTPAPEPAELPPFEALASFDAPPPLFESPFTGERSNDLMSWLNTRRPELLASFTHYMYGQAPEVPVDEVREIARVDDVEDGLDHVAYRVQLSGGAFTLGLFVPRELPEGAPVVLGPNKCGNQSLTDDERVPVSEVNNRCGELATRGARASLWPLTRLVDEGVILATFHEAELAPDVADRFHEGILDDESPGQTLSAWARGNSRALDVLQDLGFGGPVFVYGHSRRGKTALLSAARDERFFGVIAHQSGTGGAPLQRNDVGESIELITSAYPHWFLSTSYPGFAGFETRLPFDQHALIALSAPRPVLLVDGEDDFWADPEGARDAARAAEPAWSLYGSDAYPEWRTRPGAHSVEPSDWDIFLDFITRVTDR